MMRSILVVVGAGLLSWVILCFSVVAWLSWTPSGHLVRGPEVANKNSTTIQREYRDPFERLEKAKTGYQLIVIPVISIIVGVVVGLAGKTCAGWLAVLALVPLQVFLLDAEGSAGGAFVRALVYFLLAYLCGSKVQRMSAGRIRCTA
ncbi:MAG TPA: hypothetical protein VN946_25315 [Terriglobales bacterium]|jgi:hypothetical protein|nr:hypothetical protein [Terriglobales bacterium]